MKPQTREAFRVLRAQARDRDAQDGVLRESQARLFPALIQILGDRHLAEDVMPDVFMAICRDLKWLREPRFFCSYRIAVRSAMKQLQRRKHRVAMTLVDSVAARPETYRPPDTECIERLRSAVPCLSLGDRFVVVLHYFEGLSLPELGELFAVPVGTVKSSPAHTLAGLRRALGFQEI